MDIEHTNPVERRRPQLPRGKRGRVTRGVLLAGLPALLLGGWLLSTGTARAFGPGGGADGARGEHGRGHFMEKRIDKILDQVSATDAQKQQVKAVFARVKPEMKTLHEERAKLRQAMNRAFAADPINSAELERLRQETLRLAERKSAVFTKAVIEAGQVLTAEQRKKVTEHMGRHRGPKGL